MLVNPLRSQLDCIVPFLSEYVRFTYNGTSVHLFLFSSIKDLDVASADCQILLDSNEREYANFTNMGETRRARCFVQHLL